jgi:hypothetical protein
MDEKEVALRWEIIKRIKLGKRPRRKDIRSIPYKRVRVPVTVLPPPPSTFDAQAKFSVVDTNMFLNDVYGDCVLAAAYHFLVVMEKWETGQILTPTDTEIKNTYFALTGGSDSGLVILDFLNYFRQSGIPIRSKLYKIKAFVTVDWTDKLEFTDCVYYLYNVFCGIELPLSAKTQFENGQPWTVTTGPDAEPGSWGGHGVYGPAYLEIVEVNEIGPVFETWGVRQQATWAWVKKYFSEMYGLVPAQNIPNSPIQPDLLNQELQEITNDPSQQITVLTLSLPDGTVGKPYSASLDAQGGTLPYTWTISSGNLPAGLSLVPDGTISGTPVAVGTYGNITFMVDDNVGNGSGVVLSITIKKNTPNPTGCCKTGVKILRVLGRKRLVIKNK